MAFLPWATGMTEAEIAAEFERRIGTIVCPKCHLPVERVGQGAGVHVCTGCNHRTSNCTCEPEPT